MFNHQDDTILPLDYDWPNTNGRRVQQYSRPPFIWRLLRWMLMRLMFAMLPTLIFSVITIGILWWNFSSEISALFNVLLRFQSVPDVGEWLTQFKDQLAQ